MSRQPVRIGDPSLRPEEGHVVVVSTPEMEANAARLTSLGAFIWLGGNRPSVNAAEIREALQVQFGIERVKVVPHYPEDFFALFDYQHHRDKVTASPGRFRHAGLDIHAANWRFDAQADVVQGNFHVHLCIESIPLNAWSDSVAAQVLGPNTFVHYFDVATLRQEDASCLKLWAWSANPSAIHKVQQVTFASHVATGVGGAPSSAIGHAGIKKRVLVHMDLLEDYTPDASGRIPRRPRTQPFTIRLGVVDGESRLRDRQEPAPQRRDDNDHHRRDEDDDRDREDRRGRDEDGQTSSWRDRFFRSRSRAPTRRPEDGRGDSRRGDRDGRDVRYEDRRDGRRRRADLDSLDGRKIDLCRVQRLTSGEVIPASGRRARHHPQDRSPRLAAAVVTEESRGRSPPPSPRTTSRDIIEIATASPVMSWLRRAACLGSKVQPSLTLEAHEATAATAPLIWNPAAPEDLPPEVMQNTPSPCSSMVRLGASPVLAAVYEADREELQHGDATLEQPSGEATEEGEATPLFIPRIPALLPSPSPRSTPPRRPTARRKTLAGVSGFQLPRRSPRIQAKKRVIPIAKLAEQLLCRRMGIVSEDGQVTEAAITKFADMFQGRLPDITIAALRALFMLDCDLATAVEDALVQHGGEGGPDMSAPTVGEA